MEEKSLDPLPDIKEAAGLILPVIERLKSLAAFLFNPFIFISSIKDLLSFLFPIIPPSNLISAFNCASKTLILVINRLNNFS